MPSLSLYDVPAAVPDHGAGPTLEVEVDFHGGATVRVRGRLDLSTVHRLEDVLLCARTRRSVAVVLDLDGLSGCDRYAAAHLRTQLDQLVADGVALRLVAGPAARRLLADRGFRAEV